MIIQIEMHFQECDCSTDHEASSLNTFWDDLYELVATPYK